ncbi:IS110 family transposase [Rhodocytophaga aerolata]|uniref:IS110 family transposase n=1 Tax=Rhodocytophaga aerolata TaxID=455078 RepID=A0ABT8RI18_9BACT|nr:IS110 family transposase [Rhodocytophaga aerolata]MDO1451739.1 IS110 family transposase [Rhodocytophaga aerolata]
MMKKQVFIGIDVSKVTIDVSLFIPATQKLLHQQFSNKMSGFKQMLSWIEKQYSLTDCLFCMEDTGLYSYHLCYFLSSIQAHYVVESAYRIKHSMGIVRGKSDKADSAMVATYAYRHADTLTLHQLPASKLMELKLLLTHRNRLLKQKNRLSCALYELKGVESLLDVSFIIAAHKAQIKAIKEQIKQANTQIKGFFKEDKQLAEQYKLLSSVPGVGLLIAAHMLAYSEGFTKFSSWRKFACYVGTAPFPKQSGTSIKGRTKVSAIGNRRLKGLLSMGAVNMIRTDTEYRRFYKRRIKEGKHHMVVLNTIRNKLISRMFAVIRRQTPYVALQI